MCVQALRCLSESNNMLSNFQLSSVTACSSDREGGPCGWPPTGIMLLNTPVPVLMSKYILIAHSLTSRNDISLASVS